MQKGVGNHAHVFNFLGMHKEKSGHRGSQQERGWIHFWLWFGLFAAHFELSVTV
jgi:hypothetical protein